MFGIIRRNKHSPQPGVRVVYGSTFDNKPYSIALEDNDVGVGSSAKIRKGYIPGTNRLVAVKVFGDLLGRDKQQMLYRELHFASKASLHHPFILAFIGTAAVGEQTAIVSLYMKNGNLMEYIISHPKCDKKTLIVQVAEAVEFLHVTTTEKLVHGDLKCENVLVSDAGHALLADFGLSSFVEKSDSLSTTMTAIRKMSTVQFAAPELLGIPEDAGHSDMSPSKDEDLSFSKKTTESDVYAFGMLILQAITEKPPWGKKNEFAVLKSLSDGQCPPRPTLDGTFVAMSHSWWDVCRSCWKFKSRERPRISDVLRRLKASEPMPCRELPFKQRMASAQYISDGTTIIARPYGDSIILFDIATDHTRCLWPPDTDVASKLATTPAVSPDGRHIACCAGKTVAVLDAASAVVVTSMRHDGFPTCVAFSRDGAFIASGTYDGSVQLWDAATGAAVAESRHGHPENVIDVSFSPDSLCLASVSGNGTIRLWDSRTCAPMKTLHSPPRVHSMAFSPVDMHIVTGDSAGLVVIWDALEGRPAHTFTLNHDAATVAFSPCGRYVAAGGEPRTIIIWDVRGENQVGAHLHVPDDMVFSVAFSPDGKSLVSAGSDWKIRVWDLFD